MKPATLKALRGSIRKWEEIVAGRVADIGVDNCPLCARFNTIDNEDCISASGETCPVAIAVGHPYCYNTPHREWLDALDMRRANYDVGTDEVATDDETVMCAVLELEFLRDLLPKGRK